MLPPPPRAVHPFAYSAGGALPFAALGETGMDMGAAEYLDEQSRGQRPESEVLSRGAGMRYLNQPQAVFPGGKQKETPSESRESAGMGTFGMDVPPIPIARSPVRCTPLSSVILA